MKIPVLLLALAVATPALAQTPDAPAAPRTLYAHMELPTLWEFSPDFLRDQNNITWFMSLSAQFSAMTTGTGIPKSETILFSNKPWKVTVISKATFDKHGNLQKQESLDGKYNSFEETPNPIIYRPLSLQTSVNKGRLARRVLTLDTGQSKNFLTCDYDARGRRQRDVFTASDGTSRTVNYFYDAQGLSKITDGAANILIERNKNGQMRSLSATQNGLLMRSATPIKDDKGAIIGTRIEDYNSGILQEVNEITQESGATKRTSQTLSDTTSFINGQQTNERKFEFRMDIGSNSSDVAAVESRKRTVYKNAKIATEELFRNGVLTQRSEFNDNGVIENVTSFNADGSVVSAVDLAIHQVPYVDGG